MILLAMLKDLETRGVGFKSLGGPTIDTTSAHGELLLTMLGAIATFERRLIRQRCSEGIARAKAEGRHYLTVVRDALDRIAMERLVPR